LPTSPLFPYTTLFRSPLTISLPASESRLGRFTRTLAATRRTLPQTAGWAWFSTLTGCCKKQPFVTGVPDNSNPTFFSGPIIWERSEEHTSELQSRFDL